MVLCAEWRNQWKNGKTKCHSSINWNSGVRNCHRGVFASALRCSLFSLSPLYVIPASQYMKWDSLLVIFTVPASVSTTIRSLTTTTTTKRTEIKDVGGIWTGNEQPFAIFFWIYYAFWVYAFLLLWLCAHTWN